MQNGNHFNLIFGEDFVINQWQTVPGGCLYPHLLFNPTTRLIAFYVIRDMWNCSGCLPFPSPLLVSMYIKICVVTKQTG